MTTLGYLWSGQDGILRRLFIIVSQGYGKRAVDILTKLSDRSTKCAFLGYLPELLEAYVLRVHTKHSISAIPFL